jgi:hypothetical protein
MVGIAVEEAANVKADQREDMPRAVDRRRKRTADILLYTWVFNTDKSLYSTNLPLRDMDELLYLPKESRKAQSVTNPFSAILTETPCHRGSAAAVYECLTLPNFSMA